MDTFDMDADYRRNKYNKNRSILKGLCEQLGVSTSIYTPQSKPTSTARPYSSTTNRTSVNRQTTSTSSYSSSNSDEDTPWGCIIIIVAIIIFIFLISTCS